MSVDPAPWSHAPVASPAARPRVGGHGAVTSLRRYRAERLLARDFASQRGPVLRRVRARLHAHGMRIGEADLEACYAQAWQGLYATVLAGGQISSTVAWLVVVTFRRAVECQRAQRATATLADADADAGELAGAEADLEGLIDDRDRLRQVFEGLRGRLSARECEAATLCYLQGLSRAEAAAQMGISERRLYKLMDGEGSQRPGVAGKVGALVGVIRSGRWCEEQASLMRGLAFGVLDPAGERHRLAVVHQRECPACRAYVASLRNLAAVIPAPALPLALGTAGGAGAGAGAGAGTASTAAGLGGGAGAVGTASGGWLLAGGGLGAKVAGCLIVLGIGAGCVTLGLPVRIGHSSPPAIRRASAARAATAPRHARDTRSSAQPRGEHGPRAQAAARQAPAPGRLAPHPTLAAAAAVAPVATATLPVQTVAAAPTRSARSARSVRSVRSVRVTGVPRHRASGASRATAPSQFSFERGATTPSRTRRARRRSRRHARTRAAAAAVHPLTVETLARAATTSTSPAAPSPAPAPAPAPAPTPTPASTTPAPRATVARSSPSTDSQASGEFGFETGGGR